jgi:ATP-dependent HslUV protease ATP-binding subunit HslU
VVIRLPSASDDLRSFDALTPREIVAELDRYVVGQAAAKRAVASALRQRLRRLRLPPEVAAEVTPRNLLLIGPTGVGKTELEMARGKLQPLVRDQDLSRFIL